MMAILAFLLSNPTILAIGAGIVAAAGAWVHGRLSGAAAERNKQTVADVAARTEGQQIDDAVAGRSPDDNRGRLSQWSKS